MTAASQFMVKILKGKLLNWWYTDYLSINNIINLKFPHDTWICSMWFQWQSFVLTLGSVHIATFWSAKFKSIRGEEKWRINPTSTANTTWSGQPKRHLPACPTIASTVWVATYLHVGKLLHCCYPGQVQPGHFVPVLVVVTLVFQVAEGGSTQPVQFQCKLLLLFVGNNINI